MPKITTPLTDARIRNAKPRDKAYKMSDGEGMFIDVLPSGSRIWRLKFRQANGKENLLTFVRCSVQQTAVAVLQRRRPTPTARTILSKLCKNLPF